MYVVAKKHIALDHLEGHAIDHKGRNLAFATAADLRDTTSRWLAPSGAARVAGFSAADAALIDTARAIRDYIAHRSDSSRDRMNDLLSTIGCTNNNAGLGRGKRAIYNIGAFLKTRSAGQSRLARYAGRLQRIGRAM